jgi:predicted Fe-Mo cluster-binding NifX family protein
MNRRVAVVIGSSGNGNNLVAKNFDSCKSIVVYEISKFGNVVVKETYPNPQLQSKQKQLDLLDFLDQLCLSKVIGGEFDDEDVKKLNAIDIRCISLPGYDLENVEQQYIKKNYIYKPSIINELV